MNLIKYRISRKKQVSIVIRRAVFAGLALVALFILMSIIMAMNISPR